MNSLSTIDAALIKRPTILLVDDEPANLHVLKRILEDSYRLLFARDGTSALKLAREELPDLILLDIVLPDRSGLEICRELRANELTTKIPVVFVTGLSDSTDETEGFDAGAVDYVVKPVNAAVVRARVRVHLSMARFDEVMQTRLEIVQTLGRAGEFKDNETGQHVLRMSEYSRVLAFAAGFSNLATENLFNAAPMHDIGKIGIPDAILRKNGPLNDAEWEIMKRHTVIGAEIIGEHSSPLLKMARQIALTHHERWDGSGYPRGLKGEEIPIEGRIVAIADVFDALTTERPYKSAWTVEDALAVMTNDAGSHFDPTLLELFVDELPAILAIKDKLPDSAVAEQEADLLRLAGAGVS